MTSFKQIEANRRNARLSTGPATDEGKRRSRQNAVRHRLTAETVIEALEDAEDYAAFEKAITGDYDAQTAVERELVLRLASLLWRLRRATAIESGLFKIQAKQLLQFRRRRRAYLGTEEDMRRQGNDPNGDLDAGSRLTADTANQSNAVTHSFLRLTNLPTYPLDRLSRYEATLWRQACQILLTLRFFDHRKPWARLRLR